MRFSLQFNPLYWKRVEVEIEEYMHKTNRFDFDHQQESMDKMSLSPRTMACIFIARYQNSTMGLIDPSGSNHDFWVENTNINNDDWIRFEIQMSEIYLNQLKFEISASLLVAKLTYQDSYTQHLSEVEKVCALIMAAEVNEEHEVIVPSVDPDLWIKLIPDVQLVSPSLVRQK